MATIPRISPCLWFDDQAEQAARFYVSVFPDARVTAVTRYPAVGQEIHGRRAGSVMTVEFVLNGLAFTALNGGPLFKFNEAISLQVLCETQAEIDHYWEKLGEGGDPAARQCGWLKTSSASHGRWRRPAWRRCTRTTKRRRRSASSPR